MSFVKGASVLFFSSSGTLLVSNGHALCSNQVLTHRLIGHQLTIDNFREKGVAFLSKMLGHRHFRSGSRLLKIPRGGFLE